MKRLLFACLFALAACQPAETDPAYDEAGGAELLARYEAARADADYEIAEALGDELRQRHGETAAATTMRATLDDVRAEAEKMRQARRLKGLWTYQVIAVEGGSQHSASLDSRVEADPEAEVKPAPDAQLILRRHPSWGDSAYLVLAQKSLQCGPPCVLQLSFDGGTPQRYDGEPADTGTGPALFIKDRDRFLEAMDGAQTVRIELPRSGHLVPVFDFEVGGFLRERHLRD